MNTGAWMPVAGYGVFEIGDDMARIAALDTANWRVRLKMARLWVAAVNRHGGDATLVQLPEVGLRGNTHFPFSDLNNEQVAAQMAAFLADKRLD